MKALGMWQWAKLKWSGQLFRYSTGEWVDTEVIYKKEKKSIGKRKKRWRYRDKWFEIKFQPFVKTFIYRSRLWEDGNGVHGNRILSQMEHHDLAHRRLWIWPKDQTSPRHHNPYSGIHHKRGPRVYSAHRLHKNCSQSSELLFYHFTYGNNAYFNPRVHVT